MIDFYQVWHNGDYKEEVAKNPSVKYLELDKTPVPATSSGMDLQEYRIWLMPDEMFQSDNPYIGFASARWAEKFPQAASVEYILHSFRATAPRDTRMWHSFITAQPHWIEHMNHFHRGMLQYILDGAQALGCTPEMLNLQALPMCNSFICRKDVFFEVKNRMKFMFDFYEQKYKHQFQFADNGYGSRVMGCFYERVLMICTASTPGVSFYNPVLYWQWP